MKLTIALSAVFIFAIGVTLASLEGFAHHRHDNSNSSHIHRAMPRYPEFYELALPALLVNDTVENGTAGKIQNPQQTSNEEGFVQINVLQTTKTELPEIQTPLEPQNATRIVGSLEADYPAQTSKREYGSNDTTASENALDYGVENYTSIHGNCSHCMEEFKHSSSIKYLKCMCSLFTREHPTELDSPLMSKLFQNVSCHQSVSREEACSNHCVSMAASDNVLNDDKICGFLLHAFSVKVYLQAKLCENDSKWSFTGVSSLAPICCHMGAPVPC